MTKNSAKKERRRKAASLSYRGERPTNLHQAFWRGAFAPPWCKPMFFDMANAVMLCGGEVMSRPKPSRLVFHDPIPRKLDGDYDWKIEHDICTGRPRAVGVLKW